MEPDGDAKGYLGEGSQEIFVAHASRVLRQSGSDRLRLAMANFARRNRWIGHPEANKGSPLRRDAEAARVTRALPRKKRQGAINPCQDLFFPQNFEQMIEAWSCVAAGNGETRWMNQRCRFGAEFGCGFL